MESNSSASHTPVTPASEVHYQKLGKFNASKMIVQQSWNVLKHDKEILLLPVISGILNLVVLTIIGIACFYYFLDGNISNIETLDKSAKFNDVAIYSIAFVYYIATFFIVNFFQAALFKIAYARFQGMNLTLMQGINEAKAKSGKIFAWSTINATVGLILQIISDKSELVGKLVSSFLGAAWNILTYFSLPSLIIGDKGIKESFKDSASTIRKTWGEAIIINLGVGLFFFVITIVLLVPLTGLAIAFPVAPVFIGAIIIFAISMFVLAIISSTLSAIFKLALYEYAQTGKVPAGFSPNLITQAISSKK